jgi:hypothetical protein
VQLSKVFVIHYCQVNHCSCDADGRLITLVSDVSSVV